MKYCSTCGESNPDNARFCTKCGYEMTSDPVVTPPPPPARKTPEQIMPPTYLWQSIVCTVLCCLPLGIPAIVYAAQVERYFMSGNIDAAYKSSRNAKNFTLASFITGLVFGALYCIYIVVIVAASGGASMLELFD